MNRPHHKNERMQWPMPADHARQPRKIQRRWQTLAEFRPLLGGGIAGDFGPRRQAGFYVVVQCMADDPLTHKKVYRNV